MNGKTKFYEIDLAWGMGIWEDAPEVLHLHIPDAKLNEMQIRRLIRKLKTAKDMIKEHRMKGVEDESP